MIIDFYKMSGTGNDFIVLDNRERKYKTTDTPLWVKLCQRRTGVGADGVLLFEKSEKNDFKMSIINADGSIGEMCANGARCLVFLAYHVWKIKSDKHFTFETMNGTYEAQIEGVQVKLKMNEIFDENKISLDGFKEHKNKFYINTGVPHSIFHVDNLKSYNVVENGRRIRHDSVFPKGSNVNFYEITGPNEITLRTYERGVEDETLSCGTGVTAAGIAMNRLHGMKSEVLVHTPGGDLKVHMDESLKNVYLEGPVELVFIGKAQLEFR